MLVLKERDFPFPIFLAIRRPDIAAENQPFVIGAQRQPQFSLVRQSETRFPGALRQKSIVFRKNDATSTRGEI